MTGIVIASASAGASESRVITITMASFGSSFGYGNALGGAVTPNSVYGQSLEYLLATPGGGGNDLRIRLNNPSLPQTFFRRVVVQSTAGTILQFLTSAATYSTGIVTEWTWGIGSSPVWTAAAPTPRIAIFYR